MADFMYQTLQVDNEEIPAYGPSACGLAVGGGVKLFAAFSVALNGWAVSHRVNQELDRLAPEIQRQMPRNGGVLVCVGIQEWDTPDPTGFRAQTFLSLHIAGSGQTPETVVQQYVRQPRMVQGAPKGFRRRDVFVWVRPK
jgi:hypothetical protein